MNTSPSKPSIASDFPATRDIGRFFYARATFIGVVCGLLVVSAALCDTQPRTAAGFLIAGATYLLLGRLSERTGLSSFVRSKWLFVFDAFFVGAVLSAVGIPTIPSAVFASISTFTLILMGGARLLAIGATAFVCAVLMLSDTRIVSATEFATCQPAALYALAVQFGFFSAIGWLIFTEIQKLRQAKTHADAVLAEYASERFRTIKALADTVPSPVNHFVLERQSPSVVEVADLVVVRIQFSPTTLAASSGPVSAIFSAAETILDRQNIEISKIMNDSVMAFSRPGSQATISSVLKAIREIHRYHIDQSPRHNEHGVMSAWVHVGDIQFVAVRPSRLDFGMTGTAINRLLEICATSGQTSGKLILSSEAMTRLLKEQATAKAHHWSECGDSFTVEIADL